MRTGNVSFVINFRVLLELRPDVLDLLLGNLSSADGALLVLGHLVLDLAAELILFLESLHKPISMEADQVESVEALAHSH